MHNLSTGTIRATLHHYLYAALDEYARADADIVNAYCVGLSMGKLMALVVLAGGTLPTGKITLQKHCEGVFNQAGAILGLGDVYQLLPLEP